ncbi:MAG: DNA polymerase IV [Candidatus Pelagadaptatus aseana]|uniref:DNA polymerase IV n=1 Tax=Candidatus Pelagadaptatus aseana TaxID=3120508 RepID=UPI0039B2A446
MPRKIIHVDADCFYAAIEIRDNPYLRNRPVAVGGRSDRRGVISACNYEARKYGVHSAMATGQALSLCPELILVPHHMEKYKVASSVMHDIFHDYTQMVEPLSLDEAYLDVSECQAHAGSASRIAEEIRQRIKQQLNITVSAGVAPSKFLAKIASDWNKPDGLFVISPDQVHEFVSQLPVRKIHGVGRVTTEKLQMLGIETCADLYRFGAERLSQHFGSFGERLFELSQGIDHRPVKPHRIRKSLSVEHTFARDLNNIDECLAELPGLLQDLNRRLSKLDPEYRVRKAFVKVKFNDFHSTTLEREGTQAKLEDYQQLLKEAVQRDARPIRLLGIGVRFQEIAQAPAPDNSEPQLGLFN